MFWIWLLLVLTWWFIYFFMCGDKMWWDIIHHPWKSAGVQLWHILLKEPYKAKKKKKRKTRYHRICFSAFSGTFPLPYMDLSPHRIMALLFKGFSIIYFLYSEWHGLAAPTFFSPENLPYRTEIIKVVKSLGIPNRKSKERKEQCSLSVTQHPNYGNHFTSCSN